MRTTQDEKAIFVTQSSMPPYEEYIEAIKPLWDSHWLTNMGKYHIELENELKRYLDVPELSLMVNGHMALEMTIQAFGFPKGSEVITTPFTFISTTHAIVRNHLQPVFCDVKASDGTMDETKIENLITEKTVAILPVHVYGNVCNVEKIQEIAERYSLKVIYDAAHAFGVKYKGKGIGSYGDASVFSFHATKVYNTIEGGAVAFSQHELYERLYNLKNFGIRGEELVVSVGANAKMNEFAAIMGLCNLRHIHSVLAERKKCAELYKKELEKVKGIHFWTENKYATNNYAYFPILVDEAFPLKRDDLYNCLKQENIHSRKYFYPLTSDQACFKNKYKKISLDVARELSANIIVLPLYAGMDAGDIERIVDIISKKLKRE
ncbi:MAG: DegT/DnrJ/EryC1/StrS family aminotransferase [Lachnospiraceae bacterium]|nr:DegT/DnrJ/EryC1/StrS family aminotransferase [Lachnospiraceae bacterium]